MIFVMKQKSYAVIMMLMSAFAISLMALFVKLAGDLPSVQKVIFRSTVTMVVAGIIFVRKKYSLRQIKHYRLMLIRVISGTLGIVITFYSYSNLVLSDADIIYRMSTILVIVFSWVFLGEKAQPYQIFSTIVAFVGVVLIVKPTFSVEIVPYLIAISGSIMAGIAYTTLRAMSGKVEPLVIVFTFATFTTVSLLPFVILNYKPMSAEQWLYLSLAGIFAALGQFGITIAYKHAPASEVSIYNYYGVIFTTILSIVVFNQYPDWTNYIGYILIFGSSYLLYKKGRAKPTK